MSCFYKTKKLFRCIFDKNYRWSVMASKGYYDTMSDEDYLKRKFKAVMGRDLDLKNPITYNEKLQWLKLYNRNPIYTQMVDKHSVKEYVSNVIGENYVIPTLGVWDCFDDIDFEQLPNQFVLKCTHDSGGLVIVKDKNKFDKSIARKKIEKSLNTDYYLKGREWPYRDVPRKIIAEKYMEDSRDKELRDYKFFCFDGKVKALFIATERQSREEPYFDFFDENFNHLPFINGHPNAPILPHKPVGYNKMIELAEALSKDIPHVRVDFYEVDGKIFFGELTFFHWSGLVPFEPYEWDVKFGEWINLKKFI